MRSDEVKIIDMHGLAIFDAWRVEGMIIGRVCDQHGKSAIIESIVERQKRMYEESEIASIAEEEFGNELAADLSFAGISGRMLNEEEMKLMYRCTNRLLLRRMDGYTIDSIESLEFLATVRELLDWDPDEDVELGAVISKIAEFAKSEYLDKKFIASFIYNKFLKYPSDLVLDQRSIGLKVDLDSPAIFSYLAEFDKLPTKNRISVEWDVPGIFDSGSLTYYPSTEQLKAMDVVVNLISEDRLMEKERAIALVGFVKDMQSKSRPYRNWFIKNLIVLGGRSVYRELPITDLDVQDLMIQHGRRCRENEELMIHMIMEVTPLCINLAQLSASYAVGDHSS
jgi:hypothetical protein